MFGSDFFLLPLRTLIIIKSSLRQNGDGFKNTKDFIHSI